MKSYWRLQAALILFLICPIVFAGGNIHKYWICGVTTYQAIVDGKSQQGQCLANTAYSQPPCREFLLEFEGTTGVKPGTPYLSKSTDMALTKIEINKENESYSYTQTITKAGNTWRYVGKCSYFEAPKDEKIFIDYGLKTSP